MKDLKIVLSNFNKNFICTLFIDEYSTIRNGEVIFNNNINPPPDKSWKLDIFRNDLFCYLDESTEFKKEVEYIIQIIEPGNAIDSFLIFDSNIETQRKSEELFNNSNSIEDSDFNENAQQQVYDQKKELKEAFEEAMKELYSRINELVKSLK